jgi:Na+-translocating ferredoxin:NAD+ oxidoreductase RnfD subunit
MNQATPQPLGQPGATAMHTTRWQRWGRQAMQTARHLDARYFQIGFLISLLLFGALARDFALSGTQVMLAFASALLTQAFWQFYLQLPNRKNLPGYLSAVVTACGISILIRSDQLWVHPFLACVALSSKFVLRFGQGPARGHILNPANLAAFIAFMGLPHAWLSPGQWGQDTLAGLWMLALGATVTGRISRWGISLSFLAAWLGLLGARLLWLGYAPDLALSMWWHQAMNGATILFAFFMISDPMTTPQHRSARVAYAVCVAVTAFVWQFSLFKPQGLIVALFVWSWTVPLWNRAFKAVRFEWRP